MKIKCYKNGNHTTPAPQQQDRPAIEQTAAGAQYVAPGMIGRTIPNTKLQPRRDQTNRPMAFELPELEAKEPKLF